MTGKQSAVMWLGILLIATRLFTTKQWSDLWSTFGAPRSKQSSGGNVVKPGIEADSDVTANLYGTTPV